MTSSKSLYLDFRTHVIEGKAKTFKEQRVEEKKALEASGNTQAWNSLFMRSDTVCLFLISFNLLDFIFFCHVYILSCAFFCFFSSFPSRHLL